MPEENENKNTAEEHVHKKANTYFFSKVVFNLLLIVLGALFIGLFLSRLQRQAVLRNQRENSEHALQEAVQILDRNAENADELTQVYHEGNRRILYDIEMLFSNGLFDQMFDDDESVRSLIFTNIAETAGTDYLFLMSMDGRVVISTDESLSGRNPATTAHMTQENVNGILKGSTGEDGTIIPVRVRNQYGTYYFYSAPYTYRDTPYMLVIGQDSSVLDVQIASLRDVSAVLSRGVTINNGFLFAVDRQDQLFLYYKNGEDLLTGQNAISVGLQPEALEDGFSGTVTINGEQYACVSRQLGDSTVICAAAKMKDVLTHENYVVFWSVLGFNIVMLLCLAYAVIVRNDFVRRAVETDRIVLRKDSANPVYFDKSVFAKVFPLMCSAALVMYGISFYTQTLLEITEGIAESETALQEVTGRYEESQESRRIIQDYYNEYFLSTARIISFIIGDEPDILNEPSAYYHTVYNEKEDREYLLDDEGNRLKSVAYSSRLQELCDVNRLDAVYIFDEDGHTIATNTGDWFFTISQEEGDQSYEFLQVLDGRKDSLIQEAGTNDLDVYAQYFGAASNYYTSKDENGNTVYVSRYAYENAVNNNTGEIINKHRSLIQIEPSSQLAQALLESTDTDTILSTSMLSGGAIVMFDNSPEHICLYSPIKASIGRAAADLGISSRAFNGVDYYGFTRVNGVNYFMYYKYSDGYYIATAIPKNSMFRSRMPVAAITAGVCFLLILILTLTVTLTNKEEEMLYETIAEDADGLDSPIFSIILPSGRSSVTTRAAARWDNRQIRWIERSPEQKLAVLIGFIFVLLLGYALLSAAGVIVPLEKRSMLRYILSGDWDRGLNIFAFSACALVLAAVVVFTFLFRVVVRIFTALLGTRGETIGHLLLSIIKYGGAISGFFYCLHLVGVDSNSLLASAGVLSLVIGLGAQSLIKDILAGIFIVFEGEFRVGDIVTIGGYRGTVMDIGLRTTKVRANDGNIKIFNNSDISGVLNMTKETSLAVVKISIEYGQDIDYVEAVLKRDLPDLRAKNQKILSGPDYMGVTDLDDSGIRIGVLARCTERDIKGVIRYLNKELLQIFYRNGINVPFPNVTVSHLDTTARRTMADFIADKETEE